MRTNNLAMYRHLAQQEDHGRALVVALWQDYVETTKTRADTKQALHKDLRKAAEEAWFDRKQWQIRCRSLARSIALPHQPYAHRGKRWRELANVVADVLVRIADDNLTIMERSLDDED